jgi:hypothetical protein
VIGAVVIGRPHISALHHQGSGITPERIAKARSSEATAAPKTSPTCETSATSETSATADTRTTPTTSDSSTTAATTTAASTTVSCHGG